MRCRIYKNCNTVKVDGDGCFAWSPCLRSRGDVGVIPCLVFLVREDEKTSPSGFWCTTRRELNTLNRGSTRATTPLTHEISLQKRRENFFIQRPAF